MAKEISDQNDQKIVPGDFILWLGHNSVTLGIICGFNESGTICFSFIDSWGEVDMEDERTNQPRTDNVVKITEDTAKLFPENVAELLRKKYEKYQHTFEERFSKKSKKPTKQSNLKI